MGISLASDQVAETSEKCPPSESTTDAYDRVIGSLNANKDETFGRTLCILTEYLELGSLADILYGKNRLL